MISQENKKTIFVAICGKPNVGKSTILNKMLETKLSIVSYKPQTTRNSIRGILTESDTQIVFVDTPGILTNPKGNLQNVIVKNAWNGIDGIDIACFVIDAENGFTPSTKALAEKIHAKVPHMICILNKIDCIKQEAFQYQTAEKLFASNLFTEIFPISATKDKTINMVKEYFFKHAKFGVWHYDPEYLTDKPNVFIASEITRETIFQKLQQEIPYSINVETPIFTFHEGFIEISQDILISRQAHKKILIGEHGSMIKQLRVITTKKLERFYGMDIKLSLFVKVSELWSDKITID